MEWMIALALISSFLGTMINYSTQKTTQAEQMKHDREMAEINRVNQEKLMEYQNNLQQDTNMIATQKGHAMSAGYSPALLFGSSMPQAQVSGGSASGTSSSLSPLQLFDRLPIDSVTSTIFNQKKQDIDLERLKSENAEREQHANYLAMKTAREYYDAQISKRLQNTIVDKAMADLENTRQNTAYTRYMTEHGLKMEPYQLVNAGLVNQETAAKIEKVKSDTLLNVTSGRHMMADINRMAHLNQLNDAQKAEVIESTKRSGLGRIMSEFGLNDRELKSALRDKNSLTDALNSGLYGEQMKGAYFALRELGFGDEEAASTVLYYVADSPKDVTPSLVNAASRIFSASLLKK